MIPERALTLWQPWAWLVAAGHKNIENRPPGFSFKSFRGDFWIHAGTDNARSDEWWEDQWLTVRGVCDELLGPDFVLPTLGELVFGAIIGRATITGIIPPRYEMKGDVLFKSEAPPVPWHFPEQYGFKLESAVLLENPVPCRGYQGFWRVPAPVLQQLREAA